MSWPSRAVAAEVRARGPVALGAAALGLAAGAVAWLGGALPGLDPAQASLPLLARWHPAPGALAAVLLLALALRAADGLLAPGRGDPLEALPVRPGAARAARLAACVAVLALAPLLRHLVGLAHGLAVGPSLPAGRWLVVAALDAAQVVALLGASALARPLGVLAWPALGSGALALAHLGRDGRLAAHLDPLRLAEASVDPPRAAAVLAGWIAAAGLAVALGVALTRLLRGGVVARALDAGGGINARLAALAGALLVVAAPLSAGARQAAVAEAEDLVSARTRRYRLVYPADLAAPARALVARADALHDAVARALGVTVTDADAPLELALAPPGEPDEPDDCRGVALDAHAEAALAHATAHALLARAAGALDPESTFVLEEGLCEHAAWRALGDDPFAPRFVAAVLHVRRPFDPDELHSRRALERARGPEAAGPLGEAVVEALRRLAGDDAPARLVAALARPGPAPRSLAAARARWAGWLEELGLTPEAAHHEALVVIEDTAPADPRADLDLPRLAPASEMLDSPDLKLVAIPDAPVPPGWDVVCRVALVDDDAAGEARRAVRLGRDPSGCWGFSRRHGQLTLRLGPPPRVQLGLRPRGPGAFRTTIWEDWVQLPTTP